MSSLSHHGIKGQRWGVRRYQNKDGTRTALGKHRDFERTASKVVEDLSNSPHPFVKRPLNKDEIRQRGLITQAEADQCAGLATSVFKQASQAEPQITGDVISVVSSTSAKMYGLNNRLKQPTSIAAKIGADAKADGITFEQAAGGLKDAIRYTAVSDSRDYVDTYNAIKQRLEEKGYTEVKCKNYFQKYQNGEVMHKAVQSTFSSPDGVEFEFQFQTPESQAAKELKVPIYNERRKAGNTPERNAELEQEMRNLAEQVPDPEGVFEIESHSGVTNSNKLKHTSIGGTMYIEGNALILGDSSYLEHHGILGQKWGVRRYQNKDGTRTSAGKKQDKQNRLKATSKDYASIRESLSDDDLKMLNYSNDEIKYMREHNTLGHDHIQYGRTAHRVIQKDKNGTPVTYVDATWFKAESLLTGKKAASIISIDLATRAGDEYRGKGHAIAAGKKMVKWFDTYGYKDYEYMEWAAKEENVSSQKTAEKLGFKKLDVHDEGWTLYAYEHKAKHASIGGTMYIEGNALILGDSSYLEHHGIRGQRWGVRRFQNRDGSLTNAGRKRLGYATKGATQAVKKAFNAGVKTGAKAVKAAKAHHEKAEAKKIEKKKEKASKTRAGVYANKDLFTAKELKELNSKFEEQDKLTMARLKRGVEIAKSIGEVAKSAGEVGKAYEALTGHKLVPDIMTLQNGGSKDKDSKDTKDKDSKDTKDKDNGTSPEDNGSGDKPKDNDVKGSKWDDSDLRNQMEAAKKQGSKAMKNAKLQEYIDAYNRDQNSEKNKELTARGQKAIEILSKGGGFSSEAPKPPTPPTPKPAPSSNNLMAQIRAAQTKLEKPNKNETPAEHKEAQKKLNTLEKVANEYKAAANKPGANPAEITEKLLKKNKDILDDIKHMDFSDGAYLEHYGVRGMKWGKHLMAGKGGDLYEGTALGAGGGGGPMTEEERKKAEELRKKKLEEAKKKAEEAAKEKEIEKKAKEIGISAKAYKRYSIDNNRLPGKHHYNKSQKLHGEASSSVAEAQAVERQAHMNRAKAASLNRKVNSSHMFDADGYHISQQRGDDRKEAKRLEKEAKQLDKKSKKALKKFYKKRYKADKERQKWQSSTSGKYHHLMRHYEIQNGVLFVDSSDGFAHHGVKGQKWGVRRFQNEDGTLTPKGRKHYEKKIEKLNRKQVSSDTIRGTLERQHPFAITGSAILGAVAAGMSIAATGGASVAAIAAGSAISAAVSAGLTHATYSVSEAWEGRGTRMRSKKIAKYENMLKQSDKGEGMYHVENGTLFINAGEPYLEHHGVKGMKWGKHLMAGKGEAGAGGGSGEDDEKLKEMAKKAGMTVAEYRTKMASKIGGAASKVGEKVYDAAGGSHKKNAEGWRKMAQEESNAARASEKSSHENSARAASQDRKYGSGGDVYRRAADSDKENAKTHHSNAKVRSERAASEQAAYEKSLAGKYDKMKADVARKKSARKEKTFSGTSPKEKKRLKDVAGELYGSKHRKDFERNARLLEGSTRSAVEIGRDTYKRHGPTSGFNDPTYKATDDAYKRANKQWNNARVAGKKYDRSIAKRVDSIASKVSKARKRRVKHSDDTNAIYTEGTRLVVNSKWG